MNHRILNDLTSFALFIIIALILTSCQKYTGEPQKVDTETFTISLPDFMSESKNLHENAILQYSSRYRSFYTIVFEDSKDQDFESYQRDAIHVILSDSLYKDIAIVDSIQSDIQGNRYIEMELYGIMNKQKVYYNHRTIESPNKFYQVVVWTRGADHKLKYSETIKDILNSFTIK